MHYINIRVHPYGHYVISLGTPKLKVVYVHPFILKNGSLVYTMDHSLSGLRNPKQTNIY
jgi:hypothetical protein